MILSPRREWFDGERILHIEPQRSRRVDDGFLLRPYLYTGRALTDTTLIRSAQHRLRHLMLFGRQMSAGVVTGLELTHHTRTPAPGATSTAAEQWLRIGEGLGLTVYGDDISITGTADILLDNVAVVGGDGPARGPGILVLEPVEIFEETAVDPQSQCPWDRERDPLEDEQLIDGCRLVFFPWPPALEPAPPATAATFRNQLAYQVFDYELEHPFDLLPWEATGVALGLTHISDEGEIAFIDPYAVVRQGGAPPSVTPLLTTNGSPLLWESRIRQLTHHLYDIKAKDPQLPSAADHVAVLPPAGFLPKQILDVEGMSTAFFPSQFVVDAVPIPEEQLEAALNASAGLTPFDLQKPEKIKLLVPVPQAVFEPDLLVKAVPDPIFLETLRKLVHEIRKQIANRAFLRNRANQVVGVIDFKEIPVFAADDPDATPDERKFPVVIAPEAGITDYGQRAVAVIATLRQWLEDHTTIYWKDYQVIDPEAVGSEDFMGLEAYILALSQHIDTTEEYISANYVKTEAEIYRLRQLMIGNIKASRLATSPAMGMVVEGQTRAPTAADVERYFEEAASASAQSDAEKPVLEKAETRMAGKEAFYAALPAYMHIAYQDPKAYFTRKGALREKKIVERVYESPAMEIKRKAVAAKADIFASLRQVPLEIIDKVTVAPADTAVFYGNEYEKFIKPFKNDSRGTILDNRSRKPVNFEVHRYQFVAVVISPLTESEKKVLSEADVTPAQIQALETALAKAQGRNQASLKNAALSKNIREGLFDPNPTDGDEASYFSIGVAALEHALEAMQVVDHKLDQYRQALKKCQSALNELAGNLKQWKDALASIDDQLTELRHDALVTRSLYEEEKSRIQGINTRRIHILNEYVQALAYVRPRWVEARCDAPSIQLHGVYVNPVPDCLAQDYEAAGELDEMLDLFREIPLSWLTRTQPLFERITSVAQFVDIFKKSETRAKQARATQAEAPEYSAKAYNTKEFGQAVNKVIYAHQQNKRRFSAAKSTIDVARLSAMTWQALKTKAEAELSLADLVESGKGKSALANKATAILEEIEDIAVCLYQQCNALLPAIRLEWANKISVFDAPMDLRRLDLLPAWHQVDDFMRRDLQHMVDWLFQQIDSSNTKALELMNDLVRVCILLASHAPVSSIVRGHLPAPAKGIRGDIIDMVVDKGIVRIGMVATIFTQDKVAVQGVVEDISQGGARIRVTHTPAESGEFAVDPGAQVKFYTSASQSKRMMGA